MPLTTTGHAIGGAGHPDSTIILASISRDSFVIGTRRQQSNRRPQDATFTVSGCRLQLNRIINRYERLRSPGFKVMLLVHLWLIIHK